MYIVGQHMLLTVHTKDETLPLIGCLSGTQRLMAKLMYGGGLRLMECLRLRVTDLEFERCADVVRNGKSAQESSLQEAIKAADRLAGSVKSRVTGMR
jgi:integrase